jgi:hypothetical protein
MRKRGYTYEDREQIKKEKEKEQTMKAIPLLDIDVCLYIHRTFEDIFLQSLHFCFYQKLMSEIKEKN